MKNLRRTGLALASFVLGMTLNSVVLAASDAPGRPDLPQVQLPEFSRGQRAVDLLGARLPEVAAHYRKSAAEFIANLRRDRTARLDKQGRLFHIEEFEVPQKAPVLSASASTPGTTASYPLDQTFLLHSRPGASKVIYLDFNGHTSTGTVWNASYAIDPIVSPAFDLDGVPSSFSATELDRIQKIWQRVAEDYSLFDVDVTTEEPAADRLTRTSSTDTQYGVRAVITRDFTAATASPCNCGGFAYVGVFDYVGEYYKTAYIFYDKLGSGNEKYVAEAVSHEVGHTLGLSHDGTSTSAYYRGQGSGATGWAPIMGSGYYQELTQWSRGEYFDANNREDDFAIILSNGLTLRIDDHGNTTAAATQMSATVANGLSSYWAQGVIASSADTDVFSFASGPGTVSVSVVPALRSPNLDISVQLRNSAGTVIASANPVGAVNASLSFTVPAAGTYFVTVNGTGEGDPLATGYTSYASVGEYGVSVTAPAPASLPPVSVPVASVVSGVAPLAVNFTGSGSYDNDGTVVSWVWNYGDGSAAVSSVNGSRTYSTPGTYAATLLVTDNTGLTDLKSVSIQVSSAPAATASMHLQGITVTTTGYKNNQSDATAVVTVLDGSGNKVVGATVNGTWSGVVTGSASSTTGSTGQAAVKSGRTRNTGTFMFTVTSVTLAGYTYSADQNIATSGFASN